MRLHRIRLTDVRGVSERTIDLPDTGVTIIEGPNEVGKTTTAEAVDLLFEFKDSSKTAQVRDLQPVSTDAGPRVEVEFSTGEHRGVYAKQWGRGRSTRLHLAAPRIEQLSGDEAHERVRRILDDTVDPALWRALRVVQGESLAPAAWQHVPSLGQALDRAAADVEVSRAGALCGEHEDLFTRVQAECARFFTARSGQPTGALASAAAAYAQAHADVLELRRREAETTQDVDEASRLARELTGIGEREGRLSDTLKQARGDAARLQLLYAALDRSAAGLAGLEVEVAAIRRECHERRLLVDDVTERERTAATLRPQVAALQGQSERAAARHRVTVERVAAARAARDRARRRLRGADEERTAARHRLDLAQLTTRLAAAATQLQRLAAADAVLEQSRVDDSFLRRVEEQSSALWQATRARELAAPTMTVVRLGEPEVWLDGAPYDAADQGSADVELSVTAERSVEVAGVVRVVVSTGSGGDDLEADVDRAQAALAELLDGAGVESVEAARAASERRRGATHERELAAAALGQHLGPQTWESLHGQVTALRAQVATTATAEASSCSAPSADGDAPDADEVVALDQAHTEAARLLAEAEGALTRAERLRDHAAAAVADTRDELTRLSERLATHECEHERLVRRLTLARTERDDDDLESAALDARRRLVQSEQLLAKRRAEVEAADPDRVALTLTNAEALSKRLSTERQDLQSLADQVRGRLSSCESLGLFDRLADAEGVFDTAVRELDSVQQRARAARLLARTMAERRDAARSRYVAPYRSAVQRLGRFVFGDGFEVEVDGELQVVSRTLGGLTVPATSLSGGAREQLALVERLACAELVGPEEGVPVVIDDALGWSDPDRLQRMGALLSAAGKHSQVIVLTCQPERYQHVGGASVVRLRR